MKRSGSDLPAPRKNILLIGKTGQVGWELCRALAPLGKVTALDRHAIDLADPDSIRRAVRTVSPDLIVNAAAYTAVDKAESEPDAAMAINGIAPGILAEEAKRLNALLIHFSTDYVFDGIKSTPYTEDDEPNPLNVYGQTKLAGERAVIAVGGAHLIFRVSWIYGARGKNFLLTMLRLAKQRNALRIVNDQIGAPTWSRLIAEIVAHVLVSRSRDIAAGECNGIYHASAAGRASWYDFAAEIFRCDDDGHRSMHGLDIDIPHVSPIPSSEYVTPATRPANSLLSSKKLIDTFDIFLPDWRDSLMLCLSDLISHREYPY